MKKLKFRKHLVRKIIAGKKTVTWRLFDDKKLAVGDRLEFIIWENGNKFAEAKIMRIREKMLREINDSDFDGHEKFKSKAEMLEVYRKYYGDKVDEKSNIKIVEFALGMNNKL